MADDWVFGFGSYSWEDLVGKLFGGLEEPRPRRGAPTASDVTSPPRRGTACSIR